MPRQKVVRKPDPKRLANTAAADCASVATAVSLLVDAQKETLIDEELRLLITKSIVAQCDAVCEMLRTVASVIGDGGAA